MKKLNEKELAVKKIKDDFNGMITEMEDVLRRAEGTLANCNYIVMVGKVAVDIEVIDKMTTGVTETGQAWNVRRFEKKTAERLAKGIRNGHGEVGYAIGWKDAVRESIDHIKMVMETIG